MLPALERRATRHPGARTGHAVRSSSSSHSFTGHLLLCAKPHNSHIGDQSKKLVKRYKNFENSGHKCEQFQELSLGDLQYFLVDGCFDTRTREISGGCFE